MRRVLSNPPSWLRVERMKRGTYLFSVARSEKLDERLTEMENGPRYTFNLAWPEHVKDGQRYSWIGRLTAHVKQHGIDIDVARKAIPEIVRRVPGWEQSKNLTTNLQSIIGSIYGNRNTGAANTFATRKGPMVQWVEATLRKYLQVSTTNTPTSLNPKTTYKKGIPAECSFLPGEPGPSGGGEEELLLPSSEAFFPSTAPEASPRDGGAEGGGKGASPSPNSVCSSTKPVSVPVPPLDLDGLFFSIAEQVPAIVKGSPRLAHRWASSGAGILASIRAGEWKPASVQFDRKQKPDGGFRETVRIKPMDKILHRALVALLRQHFDGIFSPRSFAYRPGKSTLSALELARSVALNSPWVLSLDITKCFDSIDHDRLLGILSERITDPGLLSFIRAVLSSSKVKGLGLLQGSPASNVLSNIYLDRLDKWLEARGLEFARYADDVRVFVKSKLEAESLLADVRRFLNDELGLMLSENKTSVTRADAARFVGQPILISTAAFSDALRASKNIRIDERVRIMEGLMATEGSARLKYMLDWYAVLIK
jgi:retron-type reverse transcriptase